MKPGLRMWVIPSLVLLLAATNMIAGTSHPAPVLLAFAPDENPTAARPAAKKPIVKAMKKAALKHKTPVWRPTPSPPVDKPQPPQRPWPETAPM
jgi:hypothetical protein